MDSDLAILQNSLEQSHDVSRQSEASDLVFSLKENGFGNTAITKSHVNAEAKNQEPSILQSIDGIQEVKK